MGRRNNSISIKLTSGTNDKLNICAYCTLGVNQAWAKLLLSTVVIGALRGKGSGTGCYCWQPNHQKRSSGQLLNQWFILPTGVSLRTRRLRRTISGSVIWSSLRSHQLVPCPHKIYYAGFGLDVSQWYCLKSPVTACGRQNGCCAEFISVQQPSRPSSFLRAIFCPLIPIVCAPASVASKLS